MAEKPTDGNNGAPSAGRASRAQAENDLDLRTVSRQRRYQLAINDPEPVGEPSAIWRGFSQVATVGIFVLLLIAALELGRPPLLPTVSAVVIGMILGPLSSRALRPAASCLRSGAGAQGIRAAIEARTAISAGGVSGDADASLAGLTCVAHAFMWST